MEFSIITPFHSFTLCESYFLLSLSREVSYVSEETFIDVINFT